MSEQRWTIVTFGSILMGAGVALLLHWNSPQLPLDIVIRVAVSAIQVTALTLLFTRKERRTSPPS